MALDGSYRIYRVVCHCQHHCQAKQGDGHLRHLLRFCHHSWCQEQQHPPSVTPSPPELWFLIHWPQLGAEMQSLSQGEKGEKPYSVCNTRINCSMYCWARGSLQSQNVNIGRGLSLACIIMSIVPWGILLPVEYRSFCKLSHIPSSKEGHTDVLV